MNTVMKVERMLDDGTWANTKLSAKSVEALCKYFAASLSETPDKDGYYYEDVEIVPTGNEVRVIANWMRVDEPLEEQAIIDFTYRVVPVEIV